MLWFIDLTVTTCHISEFIPFFLNKMKTRKYSKSVIEVRALPKSVFFCAASIIVVVHIINFGLSLF